MSAIACAIGLRHLHAQHRRRPEAHRRQPARRDERARHGDRELLADAVLVPADVGDDEARPRARPCAARSGCARAAAGTDPSSTARPSSSANSLAAARDLVAQRGRDRAWRLPARRLDERRKRELRVGDDAELGLVVAADLREVGVDVDQARRRNREREARIPRARVRFGEPRADGEDEIGGAALLVGDRRAPEARSGRAAADGRRAGSPCPSACARPALRAPRRARRAPRSRAPRARRRRRRAPGARRRRARRRCARAVAGSMPVFAISGGTLSNASTGRSAEKMSIGTSTSTGPGRPVCARWNARSMMRGRSSTRSTR